MSNANLGKKRGEYGRPPEVRFWDHVEKTEGCWNWTGFTHKGYGYFGKEGSTVIRAHRFSWTIEHGEIPEGKHICHHCDNPKCVRPSHLFIGTHDDNMLDMRSKGRGKLPRLPTLEETPRGVRVNTARLNDKQAFQIRRLFLKGVSRARIANWIGMTWRNIDLLVQGHTWTHVPFPRHEHDTLEAHL